MNPLGQVLGGERGVKRCDVVHRDRVFVLTTRLPLPLKTERWPATTRNGEMFKSKSISFFTETEYLSRINPVKSFIQFSILIETIIIDNDRSSRANNSYELNDSCPLVENFIIFSRRLDEFDED